MENKIQIRSMRVPSLSFMVNEAGQNIATHWESSPQMPDSHARQEIETRERGLYFNGDGVLDLTKWLMILQEFETSHAAQKNVVNEICDKAKALTPYPAHALLKPETTRPDTLDPSKGMRLTTPADNEQEAFGWRQAYDAWETGQGVQLSPMGPYLSKSKGDGCPQLIIDARAHVTERNAALYRLGYDAAESSLHKLSRMISTAKMAICLAPAASLSALSAKADIVTALLSRRCRDTDNDTAILNALAGNIHKLNYSQVRISP